MENLDGGHEYRMNAVRSKGTHDRGQDSHIQTE